MTVADLNVVTATLQALRVRSLHGHLVDRNKVI